MESEFATSLQRAAQLYQQGQVPVQIRRCRWLLDRETRELNLLVSTTGMLSAAVYQQMLLVLHLKHHIDALYHQWVIGQLG